MKNILASIIVLLALVAKAQDCIGYIPANAQFVCDTGSIFLQNEGIYWLAKDSASITIAGNNNTVYANYANNKVFVYGHNNLVYVTGPNGFVRIAQPSAANTVYLKDGDIELYTDSNRVYGNAIGLFMYGSYNHVSADTIEFHGDFGTMNIVNHANTCPVEISLANAPTNTCFPLGIAENIVSVNVYPNPANGSVTFSSINAGTIKSIVLYDAKGKLIATTANICSDKICMDILGLSSGLYLYTISLSNNKTTCGKLIVE